MPEDPLRPRDNPIYHENIHASFPVKCITCLPEVEEYFIEDPLTHFRLLLDQLGFKGGDPRPLTHPKAMQHVMELYHFPNSLIDNPPKSLPQHLDDPGPSELPTPLRNDHHHLPSTGGLFVVTAYQLHGDISVIFRYIRELGYDTVE